MGLMCLEVRKDLKADIKIMDQVFNMLQQGGGNTVPNLMQWLKDAQLINPSNEENIQGMLAQVSDHGNVSLDGFKNVMANLASQHNINLDDIMGKLESSGQDFMSHISSALENFAGGFGGGNDGHDDDQEEQQ